MEIQKLFETDLPAWLDTNTDSTGASAVDTRSTSPATTVGSGSSTCQALARSASAALVNAPTAPLRSVPRTSRPSGAISMLENRSITAAGSTSRATKWLPSSFETS